MPTAIPTALSHPLDRTRALVTGASSGIGAELAVQLGASAARVCLAARRRELLDRVTRYKLGLDRRK